MRRIPITPVNRSGKDADPERGLVHGDVAGRGRGVPCQDQMARIVDEAQGRGYQGEAEHPAIVAFLLNEVSVCAPFDGIVATMRGAAAQISLERRIALRRSLARKRYEARSRPVSRSWRWLPAHRLSPQPSSASCGPGCLSAAEPHGGHVAADASAFLLCRVANQVSLFVAATY